MNDQAYEYKDFGLKELQKLLQDNMSRVKIGIPTDNDYRTVEDTTDLKLSKKRRKEEQVASRMEGNEESNATIGMKHEFGQGVPERSFLRMPLTAKLQDFLDDSRLFNQVALKEVIKTKSLNPWLKKLGMVGEDVVDEAFATGGFGRWPAHKPGYENNTGMLLQDTTQLRESITSVLE